MLDRFLVSVPFWRRGSQSPSNLMERQNPVPGLADFRKLANAWRLSDNEARQLFGISRSLHRQLKKGRNATLARDQSTRISLLAEIYRGLHVLYSSRQADAWIRSPNSNPVFRGDQPLHYMLQGGIHAVVKVRNVVGCWPG
jgi:uncharacterized protein (DUF2384 family)